MANKKSNKNKQMKMNTNTKQSSQKKKTYSPPSELNMQIVPWIIGLVAVFLLWSLIAPSSAGAVGETVHEVLCGLFSYGAYLIPVFMIARAVFYRKEINMRYPGINWWLSFAFLCILACLLATIKCDVDKVFTFEHYKNAFNDKGILTTNSLIGGFLANIFKPLIKDFTIVLSVVAMFIICPFIFSKTPLDVIRFIANSAKQKHCENVERRKERDEYFDKKEKEEKEEKLREEKEKPKRKKIEFEDIPDDIPTPIEEDIEIEEPITVESVNLPEDESVKTKLEKIFGNDISETPEEIIPFDVEEGDVAEADISDTVEEAEIEEVPAEKNDVISEANDYEESYVFPPVELLKCGEPVSQAVNQEYETTAKKLVETLASFKVNARIINIAKGPTVTRYELQPETGVRVRAIRNLSEDIALNLASKGVRIEAPIPGKEAVGIEVPNKNKSTVTIRELIESKNFQDSKSRLTSCLGVDVAGNPVFCDIAKMPHLLIAGTTGSGKSVCINSFLVSILYKATPEEVKFILIDPKKIELGVYNGIPHLLVPVVSDPKKAAGALAWAVGEMERRFALIEEVGVRDIIAYNEVAKVEPERESLPRIVIVIDELADLMMMARDNVESSICRIAQKARAAGMHLVIGTQRPSVDVITGLIKANVPSRIAFTVASQVDSKTILDVAGAEKLVGRGDMLYAPIGAMTPTRVQGSFVSDGEIEEIIDFLKGNTTTAYSDEVIEGIEREAERCADKGRSKLSEDGEEGDDEDLSLSSDPMLKPAIEIALDSGSISTSMLQRRLKLGYARAARIIDMMYEMGIVSEFAGSKPRTVLISREKYIEMLTSSEE